MYSCSTLLDASTLVLLLCEKLQRQVNLTATSFDSHGGGGGTGDCLTTLGTAQIYIVLHHSRNCRVISGTLSLLWAQLFKVNQIKNQIRDKQRRNWM